MRRANAEGRTPIPILYSLQPFGSQAYCHQLAKIEHYKLNRFNLNVNFYYISMPYLDFNQDKLKMLNQLLVNFILWFQFFFVPVNPLIIDSLFKFKDKLSRDMISGVVYLFNYPKCTFGTVSYIGCTERMLRVRVAGRFGTSHRTGEPLGG